jgi:hypothetical protein
MPRQIRTASFARTALLLAGLGLGLLMVGCTKTEPAQVTGRWEDDQKVSILEVTALPGDSFRIASNVGQLLARHGGDTLVAITTLGDTVQMLFAGDTALYRIFGTETRFYRLGAGGSTAAPFVPDPMPISAAVPTAGPAAEHPAPAATEAPAAPAHEAATAHAEPPAHEPAPVPAHEPAAAPAH